jgi:hypothetical protein
MAVEECSHGVRIPNQQGQPKRLHRWLLARSGVLNLIDLDPNFFVWSIGTP